MLLARLTTAAHVLRGIQLLFQLWITGTGGDWAVHPTENLGNAVKIWSHAGLAPCRLYLRYLILTIDKGTFILRQARLAPVMISTPGRRVSRRRQRGTPPAWLSRFGPYFRATGT
jgi:hypothetical protein